METLAAFVNDVLDLEMFDLIKALVDVFAESFPLELDLRNERANLERARRLLDARGFRDVVVPTPVCGDRDALALEFLKGPTLSRFADLEDEDAAPDVGAAPGAVELSVAKQPPPLADVLRAVPAGRAV